MYPHTRNHFFRTIGVGHYGFAEAVFARFGQTLLAVSHRSNFAGEAKFAEYDEIFW